ncbi:hypothetical protein OJF2_16820 [Aquisphaera giovannonii]|uniref:DUF488 domain-containing protein n=1 Tax=Aquisphaera giovannonii TaxID=406548 RepID=A0A5B9VZI5_9BACT|nr:DUF488 domain-containing protein [Aquisphaera giovannonii]QEH33185.1 hypothetical protein OJF2_16820 [Aquisphaera giovannonii]
MRFFTIGYGGRPPSEFLDLLRRHGVRTVADVRLRPDRASMGTYTRSRDAQKGIAGLLGSAGIAYEPIVELGNVFLDWADWRGPYRQLLEGAGDLLCARLDSLEAPFCLLCAEKRHADCHRTLIAEHLVARRGWSVEHIE